MKATMEWNKYFSGDVVEVKCVVGGRWEPRPAVVISPKGYQRAFDEVVVATVGALSQTEAEHLMAIQDWQTTGLGWPVAVAALVRMVPITEVVRKTGELSERDRRALRLWLGQALGLYGDAAEDTERAQTAHERKMAERDARVSQREKEKLEERLRQSREREEKGAA